LILYSLPKKYKFSFLLIIFLFGCSSNDYLDQTSIINDTNLSSNKLTNKISGSTSSSGASSQSLASTYNLNLIRFKTAQAIKFKRSLSGMSNIKSFKTLSVETSQRAYALETSIDLGLLEEYIYEAAMNADVDIGNIRIVMSGTDIEVENLN